MLKILVVPALLGLSAFSLSSPAQAGCLKGAIVGGIAGHLVGHGGVGAAAGCAYGASKSRSTAPRPTSATTNDARPVDVRRNY
jgi:outer membrane lipoprotein SlyB